MLVLASTIERWTPRLNHAANPTEKGLLHLEQWAGLGKWEQSAGHKEKRPKLPSNSRGDAHIPLILDLASRYPPLPEMLRLAGHTGQVAARVKRLGRSPAPSGTLMAQLVGVHIGRGFESLEYLSSEAGAHR